MIGIGRIIASIYDGEEVTMFNSYLREAGMRYAHLKRKLSFLIGAVAL